MSAARPGSKTAVFLSASLPNESQKEWLRWGVRPRALDEAVTSLTTCCLRRGARLVFGGHPSISPLVAMVALQGWAPVEGAPPPIWIYQSEAYRGKLPDETWALFRSGVAQIVWTDLVEGDSPANDRSLEVMRRRMLDEQSPTAMFCMGGMRGIPREMEMFRKHCPNASGRIYVLAGTGGASRMLAQEDRAVEIVDPQALALPPDIEEPDNPIPYPFILGRVMDGLAGPPS